MQDLLYADGFDRLGERGGEAGIALRHRPSRGEAIAGSRERSGRFCSSVSGVQHVLPGRECAVLR